MAATRTHAVAALPAFLVALLVVLAFPKDEPHPSVEEILKRNIESMGGEEAIRNVHSYVFTYRYEEPPTAARFSSKGEVVVYQKAPDKLLHIERHDEDKNDVYRWGYNGKEGWYQKNDQKLFHYSGYDLERLAEEAQFYDLLEPYKFYKKISYYKLERDKDGERHGLKFESNHGYVCWRYFDAVTFLEVRSECPVPGGGALWTRYYGDYKDIGGIRKPFRSVTYVSSRGLLGSYSYRGYAGDQHWMATRVSVNEELDDAMFDPPEKKKK
jgi:hypothetical protein